MRILAGFASLFSFLMVCSLLIFSSPSVEAKDLSSRLGVGYSNQFSEDIPSIAVRYYPNNDIGLSAALGIDTKKDNSKLGFMARVYRIIFPEENLNFYMGGGAGLLSREINAVNDTGYQLDAFVGCEFFWSGLPSLGISFEAGVGVVSFDDGVRFRTIADSPLRAGMTFYF